MIDLRAVSEIERLERNAFTWEPDWVCGCFGGGRAAVPAGAQTQQQLNWCDGKEGATPDTRIGGCTAATCYSKYSL